MEKGKSKATTSLGGNLKWLKDILTITSLFGEEGYEPRSSGHPHIILLNKEDIIQFSRMEEILANCLFVCIR